MSTGSGAIPVIDVGRWRDTVPTRAAVEAVGSACADAGFFVIVGHGVPQETIDAMVRVSREYFALDPEIKRSHVAAPEDRERHTKNKFRGWTGSYSYGGKPADDREGFLVLWYEDQDEMLADGYPQEFVDGIVPNIWPDEPADIKPIWRDYFFEVKSLGDHLLRIAALALDLPMEWFAPKFARQSGYLVANYYPARTAPLEAGGERLRVHTDYGAFTVLYQDVDVGGLEVDVRGRGWERVPFIPGSFIVNLGDLMAKWTNDRWVATPHRVRPLDPDEYGQDRISIPFFQSPGLDVMIETIPTCVGEGEPLIHEPVLWKDWDGMRHARVTPQEV